MIHIWNTLVLFNLFGHCCLIMYLVFLFFFSLDYCYVTLDFFNNKPYEIT